jgi:hypothetical protein
MDIERYFRLGRLDPGSSGFLWHGVSFVYYTTPYMVRI